MNLTAVKFYVLSRSREPSQGHTDTKTYTLGAQNLGPFNDDFQRHVFMTTVRLPNISGRRITRAPRTLCARAAPVSSHDHAGAIT